MKSIEYGYKFCLFMAVVTIFIGLWGCAPAAGEVTPIEFDWGAISTALQNLVLAVLPVLGAVAARWLNTKYQLERSKLNEQQAWMLDAFIRTMVFAAEQLKVSEKIDSKLDYVEMLVQDWLDDHGLTMNAEEIRARIEAAVKENFPKLPTG